MTGAYMTWTYGPAGWIADLNEYIKDPAKTNPNYNWDDVLPGLRASTAWNGVPGGELGSARRQAVVHPLGLRAEQHLLQPARCSTRSASSRRRTCPRWSTSRPSSPRTPAAPTASACAARAPGRRSIRASSRAIRQFRRSSDFTVDRRQAEGRDEHARLQGLPQALGAR